MSNQNRKLKIDGIETNYELLRGIVYLDPKPFFGSQNASRDVQKKEVLAMTKAFDLKSPVNRFGRDKIFISADYYFFLKHFSQNKLSKTHFEQERKTFQENFKSITELSTSTQERNSAQTESERTQMQNDEPCINAEQGSNNTSQNGTNINCGTQILPENESNNNESRQNVDPSAAFMQKFASYLESAIGSDTWQRIVSNENISNEFFLNFSLSLVPVVALARQSYERMFYIQDLQTICFNIFQSPEEQTEDEETEQHLASVSGQTQQTQTVEEQRSNVAPVELRPLVEQQENEPVSNPEVRSNNPQGTQEVIDPVEPNTTTAKKQKDNRLRMMDLPEDFVTAMEDKDIEDEMVLVGKTTEMEKAWSKLASKRCDSEHSDMNSTNDSEVLLREHAGCEEAHVYKKVVDVNYFFKLSHSEKDGAICSPQRKPFNKLFSDFEKASYAKPMALRTVLGFSNILYLMNQDFLDTFNFVFQQSPNLFYYFFIKFIEDPKNPNHKKNILKILNLPDQEYLPNTLFTKEQSLMNDTQFFNIHKNLHLSNHVKGKTKLETFRGYVRNFIWDFFELEVLPSKTGLQLNVERLFYATQKIRKIYADEYNCKLDKELREVEERFERISKKTPCDVVRVGSDGFSWKKEDFNFSCISFPGDNAHPSKSPKGIFLTSLQMAKESSEALQELSKLKEFNNKLKDGKIKIGNETFNVKLIKGADLKTIFASSSEIRAEELIEDEEETEENRNKRDNQKYCPKCYAIMKWKQELFLVFPRRSVELCTGEQTEDYVFCPLHMMERITESLVTLMSNDDETKQKQIISQFSKYPTLSDVQFIDQKGKTDTAHKKHCSMIKGNGVETLCDKHEVILADIFRNDNEKEIWCLWGIARQYLIIDDSKQFSDERMFQLNCIFQRMQYLLGITYPNKTFPFYFHILFNHFIEDIIDLSKLNLTPFECDQSGVETFNVHLKAVMDKAISRFPKQKPINETEIMLIELTPKFPEGINTLYDYFNDLKKKETERQATQNEDLDAKVKHIKNCLEQGDCKAINYQVRLPWKQNMTPEEYTVYQRLYTVAQVMLFELTRIFLPLIFEFPFRDIQNFKKSAAAQIREGSDTRKAQFTLSTSQNQTVEQLVKKFEKNNKTQFLQFINQYRDEGPKYTEFDLEAYEREKNEHTVYFEPEFVSDVILEAVRDYQTSNHQVQHETDKEKSSNDQSLLQSTNTVSVFQSGIPETVIRDWRVMEHITDNVDEFHGGQLLIASTIPQANQQFLISGTSNNITAVGRSQILTPEHMSSTQQSAKKNFSALLSNLQTQQTNVEAPEEQSHSKTSNNIPTQTKKRKRQDHQQLPPSTPKSAEEQEWESYSDDFRQETSRQHRKRRKKND